MSFSIKEFDEHLGTLLVEIVGVPTVIDVPIVNNEFISGPDLVEYITGFVPRGQEQRNKKLAKSPKVPSELKVLIPQERVHTPKNYAALRAAAYPPMGEFLDAMVKGDDEAMQRYKDVCLAIKKRYPKPEPVSAEVLKERMSYGQA